MLLKHLLSLNDFQESRVNRKLLVTKMVTKTRLYENNHQTLPAKKKKNS
jgi:hypothetical protein